VPSGAALAVVLAAFAGLAGSVQVAVMGRFGERVGTLEALAFSTLVTATLAAAVLVAVRQAVGGYGDALGAPAWMWIGGVMGLIVVLSITFATPRLGATATIGLLIAGQLAMGAVIDRFGLFGLDKINLGWPRVLGIALLAAGAALSLKK
jgi:transporter family-2 protein